MAKPTFGSVRAAIVADRNACRLSRWPDHLLAQIVVQHGPLQQRAQVGRALAILRQQLLRDQRLRDVIECGAFRLSSHVLPARRNCLDRPHPVLSVEILETPREGVAILQDSRVDLQCQSPHEFEQVRKVAVQLRNHR